MHLCGPGLTTTSYKKRKDKITKAKQAELELGWRERNQRLKEMKLPKETFEQYLDWTYGRGKKTTSKKVTETEAKAATTSTPVRIPGRQAPESVRSAPEVQDKENTASAKARWVTGACSSKPSPTYTGSEMIGITVIHKSCLQPVFSKEAAEDAAKMRR